MAAHDAAARAVEHPVDVIWWTDHSWRIQGHSYLDRFDFEEGLTSEFDVPRSPSRAELHRIDDEAEGVATPLELARLGIEARETARAIWVRARTARPPAFARAESSEARALRGIKSLRLEARGAAGAGWQSMALGLQTDRRRHVAPLAAGVRLRLGVFPEQLGAGARVVVTAILSQQAGGAPTRVEWVLRGPDADDGLPRLDVKELRTKAGLETRVARQTEDLRLGSWNELELDLTKLAREAGLGGEDASLQQLGLRLDVENDAAAVVFIDELEIVRERMGAPLFEWQSRRAALLSGLKNDSRSDAEAGAPTIRHHVGQEISYAAHLNAYGLDVPLLDLAERPNGLTPGEAVRFAHAHGGIASINHPFGVEFELTRSTRPEALARLSRRMDDLAARRAHGADLLEVGYRARGRDLQAHLDLWDRLSAAGVFVTGVGTSDTHDARRGWGGGRNDFVTWVHARSTLQGDLIDGLRAGRATFGDPARFAGRIELAVPGRGDMGAVLSRRQAGGDVVVEARVTGLRAGQHVVWVEAGRRIDAGAGAGQGEGGRWRGAHRLEAPAATFVRLEVHDAEGPVALSNPIYFVDDPASASPVSSQRDPQHRGAMLYPWADAEQ